MKKTKSPQSSTRGRGAHSSSCACTVPLQLLRKRLLGQQNRVVGRLKHMDKLRALLERHEDVAAIIGLTVLVVIAGQQVLDEARTSLHLRRHLERVELGRRIPKHLEQRQLGAREHAALLNERLLRELARRGTTAGRTLQRSPRSTRAGAWAMPSSPATMVTPGLVRTRVTDEHRSN